MACQLQVTRLGASGDGSVPGVDIGQRDGAEDFDGVVEAVAAGVELDEAVG